MEIGAPGILAQAPDASPVEPYGPNSVPYLPDKLEKTYTVELTEPPRLCQDSANEFDRAWIPTIVRLQYVKYKRK